ncbi:LysR family transcriptional regulator [Jongsikchunia kroppenstedtii]|uniref:LysR family transcriptional regulator n=1 Tax=Jongsikchunia kroppenstedtii TaxID=1121721 RepID=UPI0003821766|nr:LysR family transcriptional regulator [Jongsikchunia kroppenstedtii]
MLPPWTPDLASLDLLLSVAELGSVGRAAETHGISQPSASARLSHLERRLGVSLLVRTRRGSTLTPAGEAVVAWARGVIEATRVLTDGVSALRSGHTARLQLASSLTIAEYLLPAWLTVLRREHPELEISVTVANSLDVIRQVRAGTAHFGLIESPSAPDELTAQRISGDRLVLVASPESAAHTPTSLQPNDITGLPLLLREPGSGTRDTFIAALTVALGGASAPELPHAAELGSTTIILATARAGGGIGVVSALAAASDLRTGELVQLRTTGLTLDRDLRMVWAGDTPPAHALDLLNAAARATPGRPRA